MKKIITIAAIAFAAISMISCKPSAEKTITSLKTAIDGEATASAQYAAFAEQATAEGYSEIAAMFQAAAEAENIHIKNYQTVLGELGVTDYTPAMPDFKVDSTIANLQTAIEGEKYENEVMYPALIKTAQDEKVENAVLYFTYAKDAEVGHAAIYNSTLLAMNAGAEIPAAYFVCPKCGFMYAGTMPEKCQVCEVMGSEFLGFHAVMPIEEVVQPVADVATAPQA